MSENQLQIQSRIRNGTLRYLLASNAVPSAKSMLELSHQLRKISLRCSQFIYIQVCTILDSLQPNTTVTFKVTLYLINVVITFQQYTLLTHGYT